MLAKVGQHDSGRVQYSVVHGTTTPSPFHCRGNWRRQLCTSVGEIGREIVRDDGGEVVNEVRGQCKRYFSSVVDVGCLSRTEHSLIQPCLFVSL